MGDENMDSWTEAPSSQAPPPAPRRRIGGLGRRGAVVATVAGLTGGGLIGGLAVSRAASTVASTSAAAVANPATGSTAPETVAQGAAGTATATPTPGARGAGRAGGGPGLQAEDAQVVAGVIGITAAQLQSDMSGGKTIAQIAQAHNVSVDRVISAWTDSENAEIDARVKSGRLTQAQGDQQKTTTRQRVTDEVNGTGGGPHGGHGGGPGRGPAPGAAPPGSGTGTGA